MNSSPFDLATLQAWMQSMVMADSPVASTSVEEVILPSQQLSSRDRLNVYCHAYQLRLLECLRDEFVTTCQFLGEDLFDGLAAEYLQAWPSQSYTLADLGAAFPKFLQQSADSFADDEGPDHADSADTRFLIDLATLERIYAEVFDGPGIEGLPLITPQDLQQISADAWPSIRFQTAPCLRLLELDYPVHEFITACRQGQEPPIPNPQRTWLAVTRRQFIVRRLPLTASQYLVLRSLHHGKSLGEALECLCDTDFNIDQLTNELHTWFQSWTTAGLLIGVHPREVSRSTGSSRRDCG